MSRRRFEFQLRLKLQSEERMTIRYRLRIRTRLRMSFTAKPKPLILMDHRVADGAVDPWGLGVSPAHFEEQPLVLRGSVHA
jgi:hypothetical protein